MRISYRATQTVGSGVGSSVGSGCELFWASGFGFLLGIGCEFFYGIRCPARPGLLRVQCGGGVRVRICGYFNLEVRVGGCCSCGGNRVL
ncbi:DEAD-box ATP-dependent RNA helicase 36 [Pyrus ussuriensis x Pyrus communis]|uniref:DEAD-box ATP-dependent RNA helicase 36 n=1 Tax=Pyrus ussuriensis x Pyrus communis TaxID=2448454 RepID=A0A5N5FU40_9ROSA|nr:DEAD-box ATP-dependent RNA helicase 36 [Pyrus ussuriensis x Pyrus communis]